MRTYCNHKRFIPSVEKLIDSDKLVTQLCNYTTLRTLGFEEEDVDKIAGIDMTYIYSELIYGNMFLSLKESFFRLKRIKYFKQDGDKLTFKLKINNEVIVPKIDLTHSFVQQTDAIEDEINIQEVIMEMNKISEIIEINKLADVDDKKLRAMKDVLTNFRLLMKKLGFTEQKNGNVAKLTNGTVTITIDSEGLTSPQHELFVIATEQCEIKLS